MMHKAAFHKTLIKIPNTTEEEIDLAIDNSIQMTGTMITNAVKDLATKDDIKDIESRMATKDDIKDIESRMATKDDIKDIESRMATKDDIKDMEVRMETKMTTKIDLKDMEARMTNKIDLKNMELKMSKKESIMSWRIFGLVMTAALINLSGTSVILYLFLHQLQ